MELKKFLVLLLDYHKEMSYEPVFSRCNGALVKVSRNFIKIVMESTQHIDFGCDFDDAGLCRNYRSRRASGQYTLQNQTGSSKCCCGSCANTIGYLQHFSFNEIKTYAKLFNEKDGFWRAGTGCILPRGLRSQTCVRHHCFRYNENDEPIRFSRRDEIILYMVDHLGDAFTNYIEWRNLFGNHPDIFLAFIDEWVKRSPDGLITSELSTTWRKYYEKNPYVSKPLALSCG
jgi:hypothetical protein